MIPVSSSKPASARQTFLICLGLVAVTVAVYWRVEGFTFLSYDDVFIFFKNVFVRQGLTWDSIVWGATTCYYEYWHPLMWWSHMLDCQLFGMNAGPHHLVSLGFHVVNTLLVFAVFRRMTGMVWRSAVVAALFALHPIHVESVAWLAERKDVLSSMFWLLSVWAYAGYVEKSRGQNPKARVVYGLSPAVFLVGAVEQPDGGDAAVCVVVAGLLAPEPDGEAGSGKCRFKGRKEVRTASGVGEREVAVLWFDGIILFYDVV